MDSIYYIGLDIHKRTIAYCVKRSDGVLIRQGAVSAERKALLEWVSALPGCWIGAMEATIFTGWVYDFLKPCLGVESCSSRDAQGDHGGQEKE